MQQPSRNSALLAFIVALVACGGAVDSDNLFDKNAGASGATPAPTTTPTNQPAQAPPGTPPTPGAPCTVSFKKDVFKVLDDNKCSNIGCHGGLIVRPRIDLANSAATYQALTTHQIGGKAYVAAGNADPKASGMFCNLRGDCGTAMPPGDELNSDDLKVIDGWLACGAPLN